MKNEVIFHNVKFTFYNNYSFKFEFSKDKKFINRELFVTDINNIEHISPFIIKKRKKIIIKTKNLIISYRLTKELKRKSLIVKNKKGKLIWYNWRRDKKNLKGSTLDMFKFPQYRGKKLTDGVLSKSYYYVYRDFTYAYWNKKRDWIDIINKEGYETLFFISYDNYRDGLRFFSNIFGKSPLIPQWAFGFWYSRWYPYHQKDFIKLVDRYRKEGIPIDVMVIDTDWRKEVWRGYDFSDKYFPDIKKFIKDMKKRNIKLTLNDHPGYDFSELVSERDSHIKIIKKRLKLKDNFWRCNWLKKEEVNTFVEVLLKPKLKSGIDFWWVDGWGAKGILDDEKAEKGLSDGMVSRITLHKGLNPQMWLNYFYYKASKEVHKKRGLILSRWGGIGSHRYPVWFSGDTFSNFETLKYQIYFTYTAGNVLTNYWSHDIGGFLGKRISKELFIRWLQFGALSPIFRTHSDHGIREPWNFDKETLDIFKKYTRLRYRLFPYFYSLSYNTYLTGVPIIRGMYHNYPEDKESYKFKYQYMIGDSLLIAPVVESMKNKKLIKKKIFFPDGEWIGVENNFVTMGKCIETLQIPLKEIPIFIKKGSIIPIISEELLSIDYWKKDEILFDIFMDSKEFSFNYYEDDGETEEYRKNKFIIIPIKVKRREKKYLITIEEVRGKGYKNMKKNKKIIFNLHFLEDRYIKSIISNKRKIKFKNGKKILGIFDTFLNTFQFEVKYRFKKMEIEIEYN